MTRWSRALRSRAPIKARLWGVPATGKSGEVMAITINRFADGRLAEIWSIFDMAGLLSQIGVLPSASST